MLHLLLLLYSLALICANIQGICQHGTSFPLSVILVPVSTLFAIDLGYNFLNTTFAIIPCIMLLHKYTFSHLLHNYKNELIPLYELFKLLISILLISGIWHTFTYSSPNILFIYLILSKIRIKILEYINFSKYPQDYNQWYSHYFTSSELATHSILFTVTFSLLYAHVKYGVDLVLFMLFFIIYLFNTHKIDSNIVHGRYSNFDNHILFPIL